MGYNIAARTLKACVVDSIEEKEKHDKGYEVKKGADIQSLFLKLRSSAMTFPGFISVEHIRSVKGSSSIAALLYNWERLENWEKWESSKLRQQLLQEAETLLVSEPIVQSMKYYPHQHGHIPESSHNWETWKSLMANTWSPPHWGPF